MKLAEWWFNQTWITRFGTYFIVTSLVYFVSRGISILIGWNSGWF